MKKLMVLFLAVLMTGGVFGTASAVDRVIPLSPNASPLTFFASPVTESGASVYVLAGGTLDVNAVSSGASLIAVNCDTGATKLLTSNGPLGVFNAGSSAYGTPAVISGETVFAQVFTNSGAGVSNPTTGTSIVAVNGETGATYYVRSLPGGSAADLGVIGFPIPFGTGGVTAWATSLLIDPAGNTIYGTSGVTAATGSSGVSIFSLRAANGALTSFNSRLSNIWASLVLSGDSIYALGKNNVASGVSLMAYNKANGALAASALVRPNQTTTPFATPAISGNSLFLMDVTGGLTAYNKTTLAVGGNNAIQIGVAANSMVTASPVTNGSFLVVTQNNTLDNSAGVTVFDLSRPLGGGTGASWWYAWSGSTIYATPVISGGVLYMAVNNTSIGGLVDRFNLRGHSGRLAAPDYVTILNDVNGTRLGFFEASPLIKGSQLVLLSNGGTGAGAAANTPVLYSMDLGAVGNSASPQFKVDAARTGENTAAPRHAAEEEEDDNTCFISTIK